MGMDEFCEYGEIFNKEKLDLRMENNPFMKVSDAVYDLIEEAIITYQLKPGERLNLHRIEQSLGTSGSPVRDAAELLEEKGLLTRQLNGKKYRNYIVYAPDEKKLMMLFNARKAIEGAAAYFCAQDNSLLDMAKLAECVAKFYESLGNYAARRGVDTAVYDRTFHTLIVEATGNPYLTEMYASISKDLHSLSTRVCENMTNDPIKENLFKMCRQHEAIYNAIRSGFPETARELMDTHIEFCAQRAFRNFRD